MKFIFPLLFLPLILFSQDPDKVEIIPIKVTDQVYMVKGSGGNMGLLIGDDGVLLIDDQFAPLSEKIMATLRKIDPRPVEYLINTHWHGDHTGGNENFSKAGATILAHKNVHKRLSEDQFMQAFGRQVKAKPKSYHPEITFSSEMNLHYNDEAILIFHAHVGHTD